MRDFVRAEVTLDQVVDDILCAGVCGVIPKFANLSLAGKSPIIYGDGKQTRDFTFVRDVVQANVLAMESDATGVFNVATGTRISVNDLAGMVMEIIGNRVDCVHEVARAGDVRDSLGDISRASAGFGYAPRYGMEDGLKETIRWFMRGT